MHVEVLDKNFNWLKNSSKFVTTMGAIVILAIILKVVLKQRTTAYPGKRKPRKKTWAWYGIWPSHNFWFEWLVKAWTAASFRSRRGWSCSQPRRL